MDFWFGVVIKGFWMLDVDLDEVYCFNDFEEDDIGDYIFFLCLVIFILV